MEKQKNKQGIRRKINLARANLIKKVEGIKVEELLNLNEVMAHVWENYKLRNGVYTKKDLDNKNEHFQINVRGKIIPYTTMIEFGDYGLFFDEEGKSLGIVQEGYGRSSRLYSNGENEKTKWDAPRDYHRLTRESFDFSYASQTKVLELILGRKIINKKALKGGNE